MRPWSEDRVRCWCPLCRQMHSTRATLAFSNDWRDWCCSICVQRLLPPPSRELLVVEVPKVAA